eukprot:TRINITY_DN50801_c0_g1_i1.p1 TRINITY_DN50801_c0_g1~~TRINITY_DN50801_c0_g1_i1.p1  ORF type:complete len:289 (+),score=88.25 TRINITY_DN50801_c0_g1_i1:76-867(+)
MAAGDGDAGAPYTYAGEVICAGARERLRVVHISDTHSRLAEFVEAGRIPPGDVLVHTGDALHWSDPDGDAALRAFCTAAAALPHRVKLLVPGNSDRQLQVGGAAAERALREAGVELLIDRAAGVGGVRIFGTPWSSIAPDPTEGGWDAYSMADEEAQRGRLQAAAAACGDGGCDVLATHQPCQGVVDYGPVHFGAEQQGHCGSRAVLELVRQLRPAVHLCGHIHEAAGITREEVPGGSGRRVLCSNAAMAGGGRAVVFDLVQG